MLPPRGLGPCPICRGQNPSIALYPSYPEAERQLDRILSSIEEECRGWVSQSGPEPSVSYPGADPDSTAEPFGGAGGVLGVLEETVGPYQLIKSGVCSRLMSLVQQYGRSLAVVEVCFASFLRMSTGDLDAHCQCGNTSHQAEFMKYDDLTRQFLLDSGLIATLIDVTTPETCPLDTINGARVTYYALSILEQMARLEAALPVLISPPLQQLYRDIIDLDAPNLRPLKKKALKVVVKVVTARSRPGSHIDDLPEAAAFMASLLPRVIHEAECNVDENPPSYLLTLLNTLCVCICNKDLADAAVSGGALPLCIRVLEAQLEDMHACMAAIVCIDRISRFTHGNRKRVLPGSDTALAGEIIPVLISAFRAWPLCSPIVEDVLETVVLLRSPETKEILLSEQVHILAMDALSEHLQDTEVVPKTMGLLVTLLKDQPDVRNYLMQDFSLRTVMAALNFHIDHPDVAASVMFYLGTLMQFRNDYPKLKKYDIPGCVQRYGKRVPGSAFGMKLARKLQQAAFMGEMSNNKIMLSGQTEYLSDSDIETLIEEYLRLPFHVSREAMGRHPVPQSCRTRLPPNHARVIYLPDVGEAQVSGFCTTLENNGLSVANIMAAKNPSVLKRELATRPQILVCTHRAVLAKDNTKPHRLHMCMWREMVKMGVVVRAYMFLDEDSVATDEAVARSMYTQLAHTVGTHYLEKQPAETRKEMCEEGNTLQCLPAGRYFEEVWGGVCLTYE
ncbi:hypothetical protein KIPB_004354 [Kipferlia bialata]|uniref:Uncharacterized protein n=1 Tax=Kipferlia bialata TaxID=797122 RepID=A0A9K3GI61_9EUKA|nr:hypothetical protein KIPB_004354 [Kipferlia bialata]|eukprot:g4354.t1